MGAFAGDWTKKREREVLSCSKVDLVAVLSVVTLTMSPALIHQHTNLPIRLDLPTSLHITF